MRPITVFIYILALFVTSCGNNSAIDQIESYVPPTSTPPVLEYTPTTYQPSATPTSPPIIAVVPTSIPATIPAQTVVSTTTQETTSTHTPSPVPAATSTPVTTATPTPVPTATATPEPTVTPTPTSTPIPTLEDYHNTQNVRWLSWAHPSMADRILGFGWVQDGLTDNEKTLIDTLVLIGVADIEHLVLVIELPFLETSETLDLLVADSMYWLAKDGLLDEVFAHPKVQEGSEPSWEVFVIAAKTIIDKSSDKIARLLDAAYVESEATETAYTSEVKVDIVRHRGVEARNYRARIQCHIES